MTQAEAPKKRKHDLRMIRPKPPKPPKVTRSSRNTWRPSDDKSSVGVAKAMSNLLSTHGVHQDQFYEEFRVCNYCKRTVCNETSRLDGHLCVIELDSD